MSRENREIEVLRTRVAELEENMRAMHEALYNFSSTLKEAIQSEYSVRCASETLYNELAQFDPQTPEDK